MGKHYLPNTDQQRHEMLAAVGVEKVEELFKDIPQRLRQENETKLPQPMAEAVLSAHLNQLAGKNKVDAVNFLGGGIYDHFAPAAINHILTRSEFYTAYTPYQPEVSQGTLQAIFEFQTMIAELTGTDVSNASLYDGATALNEAAIIALNTTRGSRVLVAESMHPWYRQVLATSLEGLDAKMEVLPLEDGKLNVDKLADKLDKDVAAVMVQSPNFFGLIEDIPALGKLLSQEKALFVVNTDPISLGVLEAPGNLGADVVIGEGQGMGVGQNYGGPLLGFMGVTDKLTRRIPGRVVGETSDSQGRRGYVLTLQTREQHIRREKATSNICSNQALCALAASVYMSLMGPQGLREVATQCLLKADYARNLFTGIKGVEELYSGHYFKEFVLKLPVSAASVVEKMADKGFFIGIDLGRFYPDMKNNLLVAVTEQRTKEEIDAAAKALQEVIGG